MPIEPFQQMMIAFAAGLGLCLLGGLNTLLRRSSAMIRVSASVAVIGSMIGVAFAATGETEPARIVAIILGGVYGCLLLAGSSGFATIVACVGRSLRNPALSYGIVGIVGLAAAVASIAYTDDQYHRDVDRQMAELELITSPPPCEVPSTRAVTDFGRDVAIKEATAFRDENEMRVMEESIFNNSAVRDFVIRSQPGSDRTNCHGWVFTGGKYWVSGTEVDRILTENGYQEYTEPHPGDLVVYRAGDNVQHTAVVRYVTSGQPVLVEGKWGCTGVFLHPVEKSIYGTNFKYYRSSRSGHLLAGLRLVDPDQSVGSPHVVPNPANPDEFTE